MFQIEPTGGVGGHIADGRSGLLRLQLPWVIENLTSAKAYSSKALGSNR
jgi:hypothetical protein